MSIIITTPVSDGDAFPATITGTYSGFPGAPKISVTITDQGTGSSSLSTTTGVPGGGGSGTWSLAKPGNLTAGHVYTITASLGVASASKLNIQN